MVNNNALDEALECVQKAYKNVMGLSYFEAKHDVINKLLDTEWELKQVKATIECQSPLCEYDDCTEDLWDGELYGGSIDHWDN
jgi:hypothetical protein